MSNADVAVRVTEEIPSGVILETAQIYIDAYERITGKSFEPPSPHIPILARIRANLAQSF